MFGGVEREPLRLHLVVALLACLVGCHSTQTPVAPESVDPLPTEVPVQREIEGGVIHSYEVTAKSGEYFSATVEQLGIDLVVTLRGPDGAKLLRVDNLTGATGKESLFAIARATGTHRLEIETYRYFEGGRYRIAGTRPRVPSRRERTLVEASELQYGIPGQPSSNRAPAFARLIKAFDLWLSVSERRQAALTSQRLGSVQQTAGNKLAAKHYFQQALDLMEAAHCNKETAPLWNSLAQVCRDLIPVEQVTDLFAQAIETARAAGDRNEEAVALNGLALGSKAQGKPWEALSYFQQSLKIWAELGNQVSEATAFFNIGSVYGLLGKLPDSAEAYQRALELYRASGRKTSQADVLTAIAGAHIEEGELEAAEEELNQTRELIRQLETQPTAAVKNLRVKYLDRQGMVEQLRGEPAASESSYEAALALARENSSPILEAVVLNDLGTLYDRCGDPARGLEKHESALGVFTKQGERIGASYSHFLIAGSKLHLGDLLGAKDAIETALSATEEVRFASESFDFRSSYFASIRDRFELNFEILMRLHSLDPDRGYDIEAFETSERGRGRSLLDLLSESRGRRRLEASESGQSLKDQIHAIQRQLDGTAPRPPETDDAALATRLSELMRELDRVRTQSEHLSDDSGQLTSVLTLPEIQREVLGDDHTLLLSYNLGDEHSYLTVVSRRDLATYELAGRKRIEPAALQFRNCLLDGDGLSNRIQTVHAARGLGTMLLGPIASRLTDQRLLIVSEGALQYIPFAALELPRPDSEVAPSELSPLVKDHEIVNIPSASILAALRKRTATRIPADKLVAVMADPVFERDDPRFEPVADADAARVNQRRAVNPVKNMTFHRLPWSLREAQAILDLVPPAKRFEALGFEATRDVVTQGLLRGYRILHLATHGWLHSDHPELSSLVFSRYDRHGNPRDAQVWMYEIPDLNLSADLVVLSACRTALGKAVPGEGLVGFAQAFLKGGATRLVVSLWDVNDRGTAELMADFYRGMLQEGLSPAAALRAAQLHMLSDSKWKAPYYWAPFVIEGEWRGINQGKSERTG